MRILMTVAALMIALPVHTVGQDREAEALRVLDEFVAALNRDDFEGMATACHYPHVRIGEGTVLVWEMAEELTAPAFRDEHERARRATGWHRSAWDRREVLQGSGDKVHVAGRVTRYREDGSVIGSYDSVWILTRRGDRWGLQAWSSFAPKVEAGAVARDRPPETDVSAGATETDTVPEGPCGWFEWRTLMEGLPPTPEGAEVTKARRKRGSIKRPLSKVTHRIRGSWIVEAVVDEKGKVRDARIQARPEIEPPWPAYEEAIVRSIRRWSFEPERVDGVPRPACTTVTVVDE